MKIEIPRRAFDFLKDSVEDIYTMEDGVPYKTDLFTFEK